MADELVRVQTEGVAYDFEENGPGIVGVGTPIFGFDGEVRASMAVVAPVERSTTRDVERYAAALVDAGRALSRDLGYIPPSQS